MNICLRNVLGVLCSDLMCAYFPLKWACIPQARPQRSVAQHILGDKGDSIRNLPCLRNHNMINCECVCVCVGGCRKRKTQRWVEQSRGMISSLDQVYSQKEGALPLTTRETSFSFLILPGSWPLDGLPRNHRNFQAEISVLSILFPFLNSKTELFSQNKL